MSLERFEIISKLYNTLQDLLILVRKKEDGQLYTIKSVRINENSKKEKELFFNELKILVPLTHKNIISYKEAFYDKRTKSLNMVIEYVDGGDLSMKIKTAKQKNVFLKEIIIWGIFIQILEGINYLHKKYIIHRDLKTSNIFLTKKGIVKIGGLNVGKNIEDLGMALTQIGTPYFTSPEIWEQKPYDYKCDIWSIGCIVYEMTTLHVPFLGLNMQELYKNILCAKYKPIPKIYSKNLNDIIDLMLIKDPLNRPSAEDLLNNKIIIEKKKELNLMNEDDDESSYINNAVDKIIKDYNNNNKKLENSHIIYKKIEKNNIKSNNNHHKVNSVINYEKINNINNNNNLMVERKINSPDKINKIPNSETNKILIIDNKNIKKNSIMNNLRSKKVYSSEYNKIKSNIPYSDLNKKINCFVSNNSTDKIREQIGNKISSPIYLDSNKNKIKDIFIKKMKINRNNIDINGINNFGYNSPKESKIKNYLIDKILEKPSNFKNEILNKNIFKNDINMNISLNNNNNIQNNINDVNMNKLNNYRKITKNKINDIIKNRNENIKRNNINEIITSRKNPKSLSNLMKYNININNIRDNNISGINRTQTRGYILNNSINLKKNRSNINNYIKIKGNNNINNFNKDTRINSKRGYNLRIYNSPNESRNINSFAGNNKKIDVSNLFMYKPKLRLMNYNCVSEKNSNIINSINNSNEKEKQNLNSKKYLIIADNNKNKIINIQKNNINYNYFTYNSYIKEKKEQNREIKKLNENNIIKKK